MVEFLHFTGSPTKAGSPLLADHDLSLLFPKERVSQKQSLERKGLS